MKTSTQHRMQSLGTGFTSPEAECPDAGRTCQIGSPALISNNWGLLSDFPRVKQSQQAHSYIYIYTYIYICIRCWHVTKCPDSKSKETNSLQMIAGSLMSRSHVSDHVLLHLAENWIAKPTTMVIASNRTLLTQAATNIFNCVFWAPTFQDTLKQSKCWKN